MNRLKVENGKLYFYVEENIGNLKFVEAGRITPNDFDEEINLLDISNQRIILYSLKYDEMISLTKEEKEFVLDYAKQKLINIKNNTYTQEQVDIIDLQEKVEQLETRTYDLEQKNKGL